jgi:hypothetical protein
VPPRARACPECGSDERTGWSEEANAGTLDLPDESFDYDGFVRSEFGGPSLRPRGLSWFWWATAVAALLGLIGLLLGVGR